MSSALTATEVAFLLIAVVQGVFAIIWSVAAFWVRTSRRAIGHWAAWSGLGAVTWVVLAAHFESPPLAGVLTGVLGAIALQRGIRLFIGQRLTYAFHALVLLVVVAANQLQQTHRHLEAALNFGALAVLFFAMTRDLFLHARNDLRFRWPLLLALPVLFGGVGYGARALQALIDPQSVLTEMAADSTLNVTAAFAYVVLLLALQSMLVTLVVARLVNELRKLSLHDGLTGLFNRRAMEETLQAQVRSSRRSGAGFAVMMLDLDYFKRINDDFGHAIGDLALKHVSALLGGALREVDRLARFGGEEFVVLMPDAGLTQAEPIAERLRSLLASSPLIHQGDSIALSVSIGIAEWRGDHDDAPDILQRADAALFQAKVQGRNRVVAAMPRMPILET